MMTRQGFLAYPGAYATEGIPYKSGHCTGALLGIRVDVRGRKKYATMKFGVNECLAK